MGFVVEQGGLMPLSWYVWQRITGWTLTARLLQLCISSCKDHESAIDTKKVTMTKVRVLSDIQASYKN